MLQAFRPGGFPRGRKVSWAHGGCLGIGSRRRARQAAIGPGEAQTAFDPGIPEWGNPAAVMGGYPIGDHPFGGQPGELKHLSTPRRRNQPRSREERRAKAREPKPDTAPRLGPLPIRRCGTQSPGPPGPGRSYKTTFERNGMGRPAAAGESPVREGSGLAALDPE